MKKAHRLCRLLLWSAPFYVGGLATACDGDDASGDDSTTTAATGTSAGPTTSTPATSAGSDSANATSATTAAATTSPSDDSTTDAPGSTSDGSTSGGGSSSGGDTGGASVCAAYDGGSCMYLDLQCWQFQADAAGTGEFLCNGGATWTAGSACTAEARMGCCQNDVVDQVVCYYEGYPVNAANLQNMCEAANGVWCPMG